MTDLIHNNTTGRRAEYAYIGNGNFTFKVIDSAGNIIACGSGSEAEVEQRAREWVYNKAA